MKTLQDYVLQNLDKRYDDVIKPLAEWSLMCMTAVRSKDIDCKQSITSVTGVTLIKLLGALHIDTNRPWTSLAEIEKQLRAKIEPPHRDVISKLNSHIDRLESVNSDLRAKLMKAQLLLDAKTSEKGSLFGFRK
jgi:hypothetical protein